MSLHTGFNVTEPADPRTATGYVLLQLHLHSGLASYSLPIFQPTVPSHLVNHQTILFQAYAATVG